MLKTIDIESPEFTDTHWQSYFEMLSEMKEKYGSTLNSKTWQSARKRILSFIEHEKRYTESVIFDSEKPVAWTGFMINSKGTESASVNLFFDFNDKKIQPSINKEIVKYYLEKLNEYEFDKAYMIAHDSRATEVGHSWNAEVFGEFNDYMLSREDANRDVIDEWHKRIPAENLGFKLIPYKEVPDKYLEPLAKLFTQLMYDMPEDKESDQKHQITVDDLRKQIKWRKENNVVRYDLLLLNQDDEVIGMSLIRINLTNPKVAYQFMTGVYEQYRRRSLAKWLKAESYFLLEREFPKYEKLNTQMRTVNIPIQKINDAMGFKHVKTGHEFRVTKENLKHFLKNN